MMDIIFFQFKHSFIKKKNIKFFIAILFILFIFLFKIKHYFRDYDLNGGLKDYMIFSVGGWENPVLFKMCIRDRYQTVQTTGRDYSTQP